MVNHRNGNFLTSYFVNDTHYDENDYLVALRGKPAGVDRFKFIPDSSGTGVLIQVAILDHTKSPPVPMFSGSQGFVGLTYRDTGQFENVPVLTDRTKATVFTIEARNKVDKRAPYGLR